MNPAQEHGSGTAAPKEPSGDIILISKQLRIEWMDALALDPDLSPRAHKVAGVIGFHFNKHRGDTFIKQETIARLMGLSLRTVQNAIAELERRGYLIVQRRELGFRASDGRRAAGGKGVANTYLPAFQRTQLAATNRGLKVAMHCVHLWEQRTQNRVAKDAAVCHPTLTPSFIEKEGEPIEERYRAFVTALAGGIRARIGDDAFIQWMGDQVRAVMNFDDEAVLYVYAPTKFTRKYIRDNFGEVIADVARSLLPGLRRVEIEVYPAAIGNSADRGRRLPERR